MERRGIFGILSGVLLTLVVLPALYVLFGGRDSARGAPGAISAGSNGTGAS